MSTLKDVRTRARKLGCDVEVLRRSPLDVQVLAPLGMRFELGLHLIVGHELPGLSEESVCADLLGRMERGVEDCDEENCDACTE